MYFMQASVDWFALKNADRNEWEYCLNLSVSFWRSAVTTNPPKFKLFANIS